MPVWWMLTLAIHAVTSVATLAAFVWDKRAAANGRPRVPERTLHILELLGGWPGALLAMKVVRHKNRKARFWMVTAVIVVLHAAAWVGVWWVMRSKGS